MQGKVGVRDSAFTTVDLSVGQRKRLALVVALLEDKRAIVLDEWDRWEKLWSGLFLGGKPVKNED